MRFNSFDIQDFMMAIENQDYTFIKTCIVNTILNNPRFAPKWEETETYHAIIILDDNKDKIPGLWQNYNLYKWEPPYDENNANEWNYEFFIRKSSYLESNFCRKRISQLCKIGRSLARQGKLPNFQEPQEPENSHSPKPERVRERANRRVRRVSQEQAETFPFNPAIALGIMALVVIVIFLVVWLKN